MKEIMKKDMSYYEPQGFLEEELDEIRDGLKKGIDVSVYAKKEYNALKMFAIKEGLILGLDVSKYLDDRLSYVQMLQVKYGLESGIDVTYYNKPEINVFVMREIRRLLEECLNQNININSLIDKDLIVKYSPKQLVEITFGVRDKVDVTRYLNEYNDEQMAQIRFGLMDNLNVSIYLDSSIDADYMDLIRCFIKSKKFKREYFFEFSVKEDKFEFKENLISKNQMIDVINSFNDNSYDDFDFDELDVLYEGFMSLVECNTYLVTTTSKHYRHQLMNGKDIYKVLKNTNILDYMVYNKETDYNYYDYNETNILEFMGYALYFGLDEEYIDTPFSDENREFVLKGQLLD
ncbi:MAG: hypothetical protein R3Y64_09885, partial [Peptostreptococcaceae bacterium]